jgi:hypothetical protein
MQPFKIDPDGIPCFSSNQIDDYGLPEHWGFEFYRIIDSRDKIMVTDFKMEQQYDLRKIHRYDRIARFKSILYSLVGERGSVPHEVISIVGQYIKRDDKDLWNACRKILKHYGFRIYYNRIPVILKSLKLGKGFALLNFEELEHIIHRFQALVSVFESNRIKFDRKYFPNNRFVALKLLEESGHASEYTIPFIRTVRKDKQLNELWNKLIKLYVFI